MAEQYLKCPNCGANATNHQNCEYCGSLLVRFVEKGIDLSKTTYLSDAEVFPGLTEHLRQNLRLQKDNPEQFVATDLYFNFIKKGAQTGYNGLSVLRTGFANWIDNSRIDNYGKTEGLVICFRFEYDQFNPTEYEKMYYEQHSRFKELDCFQLFTEKIHDDYCHEYALDFGCDPEGAARLVSDILQKVFLVPLTEKIEVQTGVGVENVNRMRNQQNIKYGLEPSYPQENDDDDDGIPGWVYWAGAVVLLALAKCAF